MRSKLTHDDSKLVVATADGYLIIIHNLDLEHLDTDTADFKLHFTESMQETGTSIIDSNIKRMFERSRNRVELLSDFPKGDKALVITSLQVRRESRQKWPLTMPGLHRTRFDVSYNTEKLYNIENKKMLPFSS